MSRYSCMINNKAFFNIYTWPFSINSKVGLVANIDVEIEEEGRPNCRHLYWLRKPIVQREFRDPHDRLYRKGHKLKISIAEHMP